jgi:type I restriction enzyme R subunit
LQLFIVSNRTNTWYFANNNARHFSFNADERFLPIYQFADEANTKITHLDAFAEVSCPSARWAKPSAATWCWWPASRSC